MNGILTSFNPRSEAFKNQCTLTLVPVTTSSLLFFSTGDPLYLYIFSKQAVLLVVATVAMAAPQFTGAHSAWPLPYAG